MNRPLTLGAAIIFGCGFLQAMSSAEEVAADPPAPAPVAISGVVDGAGDLEPGSVMVQIQPDQQQLEAHSGTVSVDQTDVPAEDIETAGNAYTVRIDPTTLPPEDISDTGIVTLDIYVQSTNAPRYSINTASVRAVLTGPDQYGWTDPLGGTVTAGSDDEGDVKVAPRDVRHSYAGVTTDTARSINKYARDVRPVRIHTSAPTTRGLLCNVEGCAPTRASGAVEKIQLSSVDDSEGGEFESPEYTEGDPLSRSCPFGGIGTVYTNTYRGVSTTIGTAYPIGNDTAWMSHTSGSSSEFTGTYGIGFSDIYPFFSGSYSESSTKTTEQSVGFEWDPKGYDRSFRVGIAYRKVEGYYDRCPGDAPYFVKWQPDHYNGSFGENTDGVNRPDWTNCRDIGSTGRWTRSRTDGSAYSYDAAVKFAKTIGIDLSGERAYNEEAKLVYQLRVAHRRMCGNNNDPGIASKVMERS